MNAEEREVLRCDKCEANIRDTMWSNVTQDFVIRCKNENVCYRAYLIGGRHVSEAMQDDGR